MTVIDWSRLAGRMTLVCPAIATVEENGNNVGDDDSEIDSEMESFLLQCASFATFSIVCAFATFATPEVVAEMVDMRTLDGCKDTMFEARAMFEVVEEVLDMRMLDVDEQKLDVGIQGTRKDTRRKDNIVDGFNDVDQQEERRCQDGFNASLHDA